MSLLGITPAPAGKTGSYYVGAVVVKDHPRTCGENISISQAFTKALGSPPHLRGKRGKNMALEKEIRITPAPAGKTR